MTDAVRQEAARLEAAFRHIAATRMAGVGLLNPALEVEAVGFRPFAGGCIGVLITPWFMNLICLPGPESGWEPLPSGSERELTLPTGDYAFLAAEEDSLGPYLSCSLFSPMHAFADMEQARAVAEAVLAELFTPPDQPAPSASPPAGLNARLESRIDRRGFLGGLLGRGGAS